MIFINLPTYVSSKETRKVSMLAVLGLWFLVLCSPARATFDDSYVSRSGLQLWLRADGGVKRLVHSPFA